MAGLAFLLLLTVFRSLLIALVAAVMNVPAELASARPDRELAPSAARQP